MNRRNFLKNTALTGFVLPSFVLASCERMASEKNVSNENAEEVFEFEEITIQALQRSMTEGKYTSRAITGRYLERIKAIDKNGPTLNAVIEINPDALAIADALDQERSAGKIRGPLHGIPILLKDNIDTGDKMLTTAGSLAMEGNKASADAFIVAQLRNAGAVILGKTNLSEWANFRAERSSSGWSSRGGQTRNPYVLDRNPCGSSSGSGVAVAANLCVAAVGTETNGSIACPSSINGIVGIKPTVGLLSRSGIIPISHTQDTAGPMTRTVTDAAIMLGAMTGIDPQDAITRESEGKSHTDYTQFLDANGLQGKRIGIEKSFLRVHEGVDVLLRNAMESMRQRGAEVVEVDFLEKVRGISADEYAVLQFEFKDGLNKYLRAARGQVKSLKELIDFNKQNEPRTMPFFPQDILEKSEARESLESKTYKDALKKILTTTRNAIDNTLKELNLAAICGPTNGPSWCTDLVNGDSFSGYGMYSSAAIAGYPHITVPMGMVHGLPVGLTFLGKAYDEPGLIALAYAYEQVSKKRTAPKFTAHITY